MKNILKTAILLMIVSCKAQSPIYNIGNNEFSDEEGVYNKDVNNLLNQFEGTYLYTNTTTNKTLKIILVKKEMQYNGKYYDDLIIGEYEYKVNNNIVISTLNQLNTIFPDQEFDHNIGGNLLKKKTSRPPCAECAINEKRLDIGFRDPTTTLYGSILIQRIIQNGVPAIKAFIRSTGGCPCMDDPNPSTPFKVPEGEYILIKQ